MAVLIIAFLFSLLFYLALTAGSGTVIFWSFYEIVFGIFFAAITALLAGRLFRIAGVRPGLSWLNPARWALFFAYVLGPFLYNMAKSNLDVSYRVVTGRIRPGIVRIPSGLKTDFGITMLANSITLTPGTLSVDVDEDGSIFVHWINVGSKDPSAEDICSSFPKWVRRIAE